MEYIKDISTKNHILVVDDDDRLRNLLSNFLKDNNFLISNAQNPKVARKLMSSFSFDLIVLDVMMPQEDGVSFAKSLRDTNDKTPILMLTALGEMEDKIKGLSSGVDDYITKPFEPKELLLRVKNILRRSNKIIPGENITFGNFSYDKKRKQLFKGSDLIKLTSAEADLLNLFISNKNKIISRDDIIEKLGFSDNIRTIDVQITRLRKKIETDVKKARYIITIRNKGYQFIPD